MNEHTIISEYREKRDLYKLLSKKIETHVKELIEGTNIKCHDIYSREKGIKELKDKLVRKEFKYNGLKDVTDLAGIRIITYYDDDVDEVAKILGNEYEKDNINSSDKRAELDYDQFGYQSLHFVGSLSNERLQLTENKKFEGLKFEIQVRTILQHSWAEIEHGLGYKTKNEIPKIHKRSFSKIAALLEIADSEFLRLKNKIEEYKTLVSEKIQEEADEILIDKDSLTEFMMNNETVEEIENSIAERLKWGLCDQERDFIFATSAYPIRLIEENPELGLNSIKKIQDGLLKYKDKIIDAYVKKNIKSMGDGSFTLKRTGSRTFADRGHSVRLLIEYMKDNL